MFHFVLLCGTSTETLTLRMKTGQESVPGGGDLTTTSAEGNVSAPSWGQCDCPAQPCCKRGFQARLAAPRRTDHTAGAGVPSDGRPRCGPVIRWHCAPAGHLSHAIGREGGGCEELQLHVRGRGPPVRRDPGSGGAVHRVPDPGGGGPPVPNLEFDPLASRDDKQGGGEAPPTVNEYYYALYPFSATGPHQLSVAQSQVLLVVHQCDLHANPEWWFVQDRHGNGGYVPGNCLSRYRL
ncbi:dynamin-binding protein-like [Haemaphysalis longicornis]